VRANAPDSEEIGRQWDSDSDGEPFEQLPNCRVGSVVFIFEFALNGLAFLKAVGTESENINGVAGAIEQ
jgi:hypothetical protein